MLRLIAQMWASFHRAYMKPYLPLFSSILIFASCLAFAGSDEAPFLLQYTRDAAQTAGIGTLKDTLLPEGSSEIRIWMGFGTVPNNHMLRLRRSPEGTVTGEVLVHFPSDLSYLSTKEAAAFRRDVMRHCNNIKKGKKSDVCSASFRHAPEWQSLLEKLYALGISTLPDESKLPPPELDIADGSAMVVEIRNGASYRAYEYSNPLFRRGPEAAAAQEIMQIVGKVFREARK